MEFLVDMVTTVPAGTSDDDVADMRKREAARAAELIAQGSLVRLWRPPLAPGEWRTWGLFNAEDAEQLETRAVVDAATGVAARHGHTSGPASERSGTAHPIGGSASHQRESRSWRAYPPRAIVEP